jgi:tripartite-type tricarboxylate transporter receptor subunit TctC
MRRYALALLLITCGLPVTAQDFPSKPLKLIVPQPPGGGFDTTARILADKLGPLLGQTVVVENRPGAGTLVGTEAAAKAPADGYTMLMGGLSNIALNPGLYQKLPYDPLKDFAVVAMPVSYAYVLVSRKDLPFNSLKEIIDHARANPDKLTYASGGNGSGQHIAPAVIAHLAGIKMTHVPYKGAQAAYQDLIAGRVDLFFDIAPTARGQIDGGTVKPLAVSSKGRQAIYPNLPAVSESGIAALDSFDMQSWFALFVPAATPAPALARLRAEMAKVMAMPDLIERFQKGGGTAMKLSTPETEALVKRDVERWTKVLREAGIKGD